MLRRLPVTIGEYNRIGKYWLIRETDVSISDQFLRRHNRGKNLGNGFSPSAFPARL
jgi:hypothetical protein